MKANMQQFRIAASGIVLKENKILLVKYENINGNTVYEHNKWIIYKK